MQAQATIYVTPEAMATAVAIKDLDYYTRVSMSDDEADLLHSPGYYLKNANKLKLAILPANAHVAITLSPTSELPCARAVSMPANLRGCIFEKAPDLPPQYADIVTYWSGEPVNLSDSRAVHFQSPLNEYLVELRPAPCDADDAGEFVAVDRLLSEGVVVSVTGIAALIDGLLADDFVEIVIPVDSSIVGIEPDDFHSAKAYRLHDEHVERIFVNVADIQRSPNPNHILIDAIRHELLDYGYWY